MRIYFTSDLHLGHKNVIAHDNRPFATIEEHDQHILSQLADLRIGDDLWVLGDVAFTRPSLAAFFDATAHLKVHLIRGNHDDKLAWRCRSRFASSEEATYVSMPVWGTFALETVNIYLSHYAHRVWRNSHHGSYHLFGHSHGALPGLGRSMDVGVNVNHYKPVALDDVIAKLSGYAPTDHHRQVD